ncbi:periplasmic nitrate reductase, NapE protein [Arenibaculum pallidiluteum]|uniref:periplasmic nitrate reductase, NapE protein n=1 Tax=Arenibaculum pallidiluteum TaxID=2812559 RepID=UPI001A959CA8|nr:periplasmic nitrate reductase, NapE protein [Arenibaculum pallidiluteum]
MSRPSLSAPPAIPIGTAGSALPSGPTRRRELAIFAVLAFVLVPVASVAVVGGYGFMVWMYQLWAGPPGPGL